MPSAGGALAEIAAALIHPDPARRPTPAAILEATRSAVSQRSPASGEDEAIPRSHEQLSPRPAPFVGRAAELSVLEVALHEVVRGRPAVVDVQGASGMGKTELIDRFVASVAARAGSVVLRGRCHPQESVSYNGFDGIIDDLSEWLRNLTDSALGDVLPTDVAALYALFPVLGRIPAIARTVNAEGTEPYAMRQRAFRALRELLAKIGELHTMVVTIDDLQWGGADTAALLTEVFRAPHMPRSLLVLAYRSEDQPSSTLLGVLREQASDLLDSVHQIALGPMDHSASCELAAHLLGDAAPDLRAAGDRIAREAAGHPFYLRELALAASEPSSAAAMPASAEPAGAPSELRVLLRDRIDRLEREDRRLLELASVGGRPLPRRIILAAAGPGERSRHLVMRLARQRLLRETVVAGEPAVEPYHSHVREAVLAAVANDERRSCHRALADTLLRETDPDVDSLVDHLLGAGDRATAGQFAQTAAERADSALAFERAVQLYRLAVELTPTPGPSRSVRQARSVLRTRLAAALANAGRSREAADVYAAASHDAANDAPDTQADLARRAAEHYLRAGDLPEGFARLRRVLADVAIPYPTSPASAVATMIALRARLALRGLELEARPSEARGVAQLARVDACWSAGLGHAWVDPIRAAAFQARYMMLALDTGEPTRVARGLATEASQLAAAGGTERTTRARELLTRAARMTETTDDRDSRAFAQLMAGSVEFYASRWREALSLCAKAETILRERQSRSEWELMTSHALSLASLAYLGDLRTLRARQTELLAEARQRGNILAAICLASGVANIRWLAADDPDEAQRRADESLGPWKEDDFRFPQYLHLLACVNISLYRGDAGAAWKRLVSEWPRVLSSMSFQVQNFRVTLRHLRARCALALVTSAGASARAWPRREALLWVARRDARHLAHEDVAWASALAHSIEAGLGAAAGDRARAITELASAAQAYRGVDMALHAASADHERSRLLGGDDGRAGVAFGAPRRDADPRHHGLRLSAGASAQADLAERSDECVLDLRHHAHVVGGRLVSQRAERAAEAELLGRARLEQVEIAIEALRHRHQASHVVRHAEDLARLARAALGVEDGVHGAPRRLVGALHAREIGVGLHVVGGEEQVLDADVRARSIEVRARRVHQERRRVVHGPTGGELDVPVEMAHHEARLVDAVAERVDELSPDLVEHLFGGAVHRGFSEARCDGVPVADVDGEDVHHVAGTVAAHAALPELPLRDGAERPGRIGIRDVTTAHGHGTREEELRADHRRHRVLEAAHAGQCGIGVRKRIGDERLRAIERQREYVVIGGDDLPRNAHPRQTCAGEGQLLDV